MVEFALILVPLLILVGGIIQFGIGLNYWLDMNRHGESGRPVRGRKRWPGARARAAQHPRQLRPRNTRQRSSAGTKAPLSGLQSR